MANRAAFEIDLPVDELKSFIADYKSFKSLLVEQPTEWAAVGDSISDLLEPIDKIIEAVTGIGTASAASIGHSAAMAELVQRRIQMSEAQTNLILLQRQDLEERIARRKLDQQKKDEEAAKKNKGGQDIFSATASKSAKLFVQMDNSAARLFLRLRDSTLEILKWGGILTGVSTLIGGLIGAGGLFGLANLANSVTSRSMQAAGVGVSYGENQAFNTDYKSLLDSPEGVLSGLMEAQHDPQIGRALNALGISGTDQKKDPGQLAPEVIAAIQKLYKQSNGNLMTMRAYGVDQLGFSDQDIVRIGNADPKTLASIEKQYQQDIPGMDLPPGVQEEWTAFSRALDRAKTKVETDLINAITPLVPVLTTLSGDFTNLLATLLQLPEVKQGLTTFDTWLKQFAAYLKSDEFAKDLKGWEADIKTALDDIKQVFDYFAHPGGVKGHWTGIPLVSPYQADDPKDQSKVPWWFDTPKQVINKALGGPQGDAQPDASPQQDPLFQLQDYRMNGGSGPPVVIQADYEPFAYPNYQNDNGSPYAPSYGPPASRYSPYAPQTPYGGPSQGPPGGFGGGDGFSTLEAQYGLPDGFLGRIRQVESGGNDQAVSPAGAEGAFQFMPGTAAQYGVQNPFDVNQEAPAAARMFHDLLDQFHGNMREAVAAYNWGSGNVQNDLQTYGADWESHLPAETQNYLAQVLQGQMASRNQGLSRAPTQVKIDVSNRTGGSAIITTRTIAA